VTPRLPVLLLGLLAALPLAAADYTYYVTGDAADAKPAQTQGGLLLSGGGGDVDAAFRWFIGQAGGGDIVVLRASGADGYHDYLFQQLGGVDSVETLVFHARNAAFDARVREILAQADGIFLAGGDQSRYVEFWAGTPVAAALNAHVRAGKPLGGTSAGLAVLGQFAFSARQPGDLTSDVALRDPFDARLTLEQDFLELALLRGVVTDSHFMPRRRLGRTLAFLARLQARAPERLLALGIDEKTALCLAADGTGRVFTSAPQGAAWLIVPTQAAELVRGQPLTFRGVKVLGLGPDSRLDLRTLAVDHPQTMTTVDVVAGQLSSSP
jgi:beta-aspartyl-peptidase (threonine type)